jgi:hypothetical protein
MAKDIEDIIAIAHYDDLQLFEDIVRTSQNWNYSRSQLVMHSPRKPLLRMQWRGSYVKEKCLCSSRTAVCLHCLVKL